jgi:hypothetical protein
VPKLFVGQVVALIAQSGDSLGYVLGVNLRELGLKLLQGKPPPHRVLKLNP